MCMMVIDYDLFFFTSQRLRGQLIKIGLILMMIFCVWGGKVGRAGAALKLKSVRRPCVSPA